MPTGTAGTVVINQENKTRSLNIMDNVRFYKNVHGQIKEAKNEEMLVSTGKDYQFFDSVAICKTFTFDLDDKIIVTEGQKLKLGDIIATGSFTNKSLYISVGRFLLLGLFIFICFLVYIAGKKKLS
ncbi:MAG: hypothetical protein ACI9G9_000838 [Psychromonas sp.]